MKLRTDYLNTTKKKRGGKEKRRRIFAGLSVKQRGRAPEKEQSQEKEGKVDTLGEGAGKENGKREPASTNGEASIFLLGKESRGLEEKREKRHLDNLNNQRKKKGRDQATKNICNCTDTTEINHGGMVTIWRQSGWR